MGYIEGEEAGKVREVLWEGIGEAIEGKVYSL